MLSMIFLMAFFPFLSDCLSVVCWLFQSSHIYDMFFHIRYRMDVFKESLLS